MIITANNQVSLLKWEEDVTLKNIGSFKNAMNELLQLDGKQLLLLLQDVQYVNSGALGVIADSVMTARKNHKELVVVATEQSVREIFNIVKFGSFIRIFNTKEEGLQYFEREEHE